MSICIEPYNDKDKPEEIENPHSSITSPYSPKIKPDQTQNPYTSKDNKTARLSPFTQKNKLNRITLPYSQLDKYTDITQPYSELCIPPAGQFLLIDSINFLFIDNAHNKLKINGL